MARGICLELTHTGTAGRSSLHLSDVSDGADALGSFRKAGPIYIPYLSTVTVAYTGGVAIAYEIGSIRKYMEQGFLTAQFVFGSAFTSALPAGTGVFTAQEKLNLELEMGFKAAYLENYKVLSYTGSDLTRVRVYTDNTLAVELFDKQMTYVGGNLTSMLVERVSDGTAVLKTFTYVGGQLQAVQQTYIP